MMKTVSVIFSILGLSLFVVCNVTKNISSQNTSKNKMIRFSEIEIEPEYLDEYLTILKEEFSASVK